MSASAIPALHLGHGGGLRLRLVARSEGRRGVARGLARKRQDVPREHDGGRGGEIRRRSDPAGAQEQGPARLRAFRQDAERAFVARSFADHGQPAGQAPDLVGHAGRPQEIFAAAAHRGRRRGRLVPRRQRVPAPHRADRWPCGRAAHRSHADERGAGEIQCRARRVLRRGGARHLAVVTSRTSKSQPSFQGDRHGPSAQRQDRAGDRRQRGHRQGHRAAAGQGRRRRRDLRAPQGAAGSRRRRDRQGDRPQDRRHPGRSAQGRRREELHRAGATRRSAASTSWSTTRARRRAA